MQRPESHRSATFALPKTLLLTRTWHVYWTELWHGEPVTQDVILTGFRTHEGAAEHILNTVDDVIDGSLFVVPVPALPEEGVTA